MENSSGATKNDKHGDSKRCHSPVKDDEQEASPSKKTAEEIKADEIRSANKWEASDLGDEQRKAKFLKLMGAAKKEHHGRIVIGESAARGRGSCEEPKELENALEQQFEHCLAEKPLHTRTTHRGLGFADQPAPDSDQPAPSASTDNPHNGDDPDDPDDSSDSSTDTEDEPLAPNTAN